MYRLQMAAQRVLNNFAHGGACFLNLNRSKNLRNILYDVKFAAALQLNFTFQCRLFFFKIGTDQTRDKEI